MEKRRISQTMWRGFCRFVVTVFFRRCEVSGLEFLPEDGPVLLCANHANALADAAIVQAIIARNVHPLARSGLFKNPFLRPMLGLMQAIPIYRRQDNEGGGHSNEEAFTRVYEMFGKGELILIFPEGQSHSDPSMRAIKTGAARIALGGKEANVTPVLIPIGLNFSHKGRFRSYVFVKLGKAVCLDAYSSSEEESDVRALTNDIQEALEAVTINTDSYEDLDFLHSVERFFAFRHGKYRKRSMDLRFRAMKKLIQAQRELKNKAPEKVEEIKRHLHQFERLCQYWGVKDYQLTFKYRSTVVTRFLLRSVFILFVVLPLAFWGTLNSGLPYFLTRVLARRASRGADQYDTAKILIGLFLFSIFWSVQSAIVYNNASNFAFLSYLVLLPVTAPIALFFLRENDRILENLRVFFLFLRKRKLKPYLQIRRERLERELAQMVRMAKRHFS